jgi:serine kinase of HPr protein (carbohydrate metabolism regulator)
VSVLHQASCVAIDGRAILIEGAPGTGKSSLALALIDRGAVLVGDDGVELSAHGKRLIARPPHHISGLIEVRNLGLLQSPVMKEARVALVLSLDPQAPRFIEQAEQCQRGGVPVPLIRIWPGGQILVLKAELALDRYGLA